MKKLCIVLILFTLTACATVEKYNTMVRSHISSTQDELVGSWGIPDKTFTLSNGDVLFSYINESTRHYEGTPGKVTKYVDKDGNVSFTSTEGTDSYYRDYICTTDFKIRDGIVIDVNFRGNDCYSE